MRRKRTSRAWFRRADSYRNFGHEGKRAEDEAAAYVKGMVSQGRLVQELWDGLGWGWLRLGWGVWAGLGF